MAFLIEINVYKWRGLKYTSPHHSCESLISYSHPFSEFSGFTSKNYKFILQSQ